MNRHDTTPRAGAGGPHAPAIEVRDLRKSYGRVAVLRGLDLQVRWGETLAILGPNGSGKTTLLKTLATLTRPDGGSVRVAGYEVPRHGKLARAAIGVVTHDAMLYEQLTGMENLKLFARMFDLDAVEDRAASVADRLGMASRLSQRVGTMSHGMRKRISIARALLHDPPILLMDEPESGLDQEALAILERIVSESSSSGRTVILTTHNLERGTVLARRAVILSRGRIAYDATAGPLGGAGLRERYAELTVESDA